MQEQKNKGGRLVYESKKKSLETSFLFSWEKRSNWLCFQILFVRGIVDRWVNVFNSPRRNYSFDRVIFSISEAPRPFTVLRNHSSPMGICCFLIFRHFHYGQVIFTISHITALGVMSHSMTYFSSERKKNTFLKIQKSKNVLKNIFCF